MVRVPTIKGVFVMSHVRALERIKGKDAVAELERRLGKSARYGALEDVPVSEEVRLIEITLELVINGPVPADKRAAWGGRLHFENFTRTPLARIVLPLFRGNLKLLLMNADQLARHVFRGVRFKATDLGEGVRIVMDNNDYDIEHFLGFFEAWLEYAGVRGTVRAEDMGDAEYAYTVRWSE